MSSCCIDFENSWELKYQGAESRIYFGIHQNNRCVIKHRFSKKYRHPILDKKLTKERTKRERRMIEKIRTKSKELSCYMPKVVWSDDSTLLMTEIQNCETLYQYIEQNPDNTSSLAPLVGRCIAELHNLGIIHGDITTSNLLMVPKISSNNDENPQKKIKPNDILDSFVVIPIDFGLSTGSVHPEERAVDLYVIERALLSTHFSDSTFFNIILETYLELIDEKTCEPLGKLRIVERLREARARGRKSDYANDQEA